MKTEESFDWREWKNWPTAVKKLNRLLEEHGVTLKIEEFGDWFTLSAEDAPKEIKGTQVAVESLLIKESKHPAAVIETFLDGLLRPHAVSIHVRHSNGVFHLNAETLSNET